ncbi:MAG: YicC family protein [Clostridiales bacterium]|jgi:uncharacterized protein (TIGR00255 family)|nr:YicC family protein [Clostridiales bacterium]
MPKGRGIRRITTVMICSMTGYGKGERALYNRKISVEIKSVNHRYSDVTIKEPRLLNSFDGQIRTLIGKWVHRGKIDLFVSLETLSKDDIKITLNTALADAYFEQFQIIAQRYGLRQEAIVLDDIIRLSDVLSIEKGVGDERSLAEIWETLEKALLDALEHFTQMRCVEGAALERDIMEKTESIKGLVASIKARSPQVSREYEQKLRAKVDEALLGREVDENRLLTEILLMADKTSIDEELTRLDSHLSQLESIVIEGGAVGRKLDFLVQELNREVNTIGAKCSDLSISRDVVELKSEVEKIREQVQNVE